MWRKLSPLAAVLVVLIPLAAPAEPAPQTPPVVLIAPDSPPGWAPTRADETAATAAVRAYLAASDDGNTAAAYALMADSEKAAVPFERFAMGLGAFRDRAGRALERRIVGLTWSKDSPRAPAPGVYAAFDLASRFSLARRACGVLVFFRPADGGDFKLVHQTTNLFTDADAMRMEQQQGPAAVDAAWANLTAHCPNYPTEAPAATVITAPPPQTTPPPATPPSPSPPPIPAPEAPDRPVVTPAKQPTAPLAGIGYRTVAQALADLKSRKGVTIAEQGGWTVISDPSEWSVWSFVPPGHPAWPAVVRRRLDPARPGGAPEVEVLCESTRAACDNLRGAFVEPMSEGPRPGAAGDR